MPLLGFLPALYDRGVDLRIVPMDEADALLVAGMNRRLIEDERHRNPMTIEQLAERLRGWLKSGEYAGVVFWEGAIPIGYALYRREADWTYIRHFFIDRAFRRRGIGRRAIETLIQTVWKDSRRLRLDVLTANAGGLAFWRRCGFHDYALTLERAFGPSDSAASRSAVEPGLGAEANSP